MSNDTPQEVDNSRRFLVTGMTCEHCVASVTEELTEISSVTGVTVDLNPGATSVVTVVSSAPLETDAVRGAINEAGYDVVNESS